MLEDRVLGGRQKESVLFYKQIRELGYNIDLYLKRFPSLLQVMDTLGVDVEKCAKIVNGWDEIDTDFYEVIILPYPQLAHFFKYFKGYLITRWIRPDIQHLTGSVDEVWCNNRTVREQIDLPSSKVRVFYAPLNYALFKEKARPFLKRDRDFICVSSYLESKGIKEYDDFVALHNLKSLGVYLRDWRTPKEIELVSPHLFNLKEQEVAEELGRSKVFLSFSKAESGPLAVLEALTAGCSCYTRDVGMAKELKLPVFREEPSFQVINKLLKEDRIRTNQARIDNLKSDSLKEALEEIERKVRR